MSWRPPYPQPSPGRFPPTSPPPNHHHGFSHPPPNFRPPFSGPPAGPNFNYPQPQVPPSSAPGPVQIPDENRELVIDDATLKSFRVSRTFSENSAQVNSIDFSSQGDLLVTSSDDETIVVYDCVKGSVQRIIKSKKYGVDNIMYSHSPTAAIHSSTKTDDYIRYLNLSENKYVASFPGHTKRVNQLALSPIGDQFLSSSQDRTIRIWDYRQGAPQNCIGVLQNLDTSAVIAYDPEGLVFLAGACIDHEQRIMLYDMRNFQEGPFNIFRYPMDNNSDWCGMKISPNGRYMLIYTNGFQLFVIDSFTGQCLFIFEGFANRGLHLEATFTPDSNYVIIGSYDGKIYLWSLKTGRQVCSLQSQNPKKEPVVRVKFSPTNMLMASAGTKFSFWLPYVDGVSLK